MSTRRAGFLCPAKPQMTTTTNTAKLDTPAKRAVCRIPHALGRTRPEPRCQVCHAPTSLHRLFRLQCQSVGTHQHWFCPTCRQTLWDLPASTTVYDCDA